MKFTVEFEASAKNDLLAAFKWHKARLFGLCKEFLRSVAAVEESLARNSIRYPVANDTYRSAKLPMFPYVLPYRIIGNKVSILSCLHFRQSPERWPGI